MLHKPSVLLDPDVDADSLPRESTLAVAIVQISASVPWSSSLLPTKFTSPLNVSTPKVEIQALLGITGWISCFFF